MPRIAIDCRFASSPSGLGRFTRELVPALLARRDSWEYVLIVRDAHEEWIPSNANVIAFPAPHYSFKEQFALPSLLKKEKIDLLFSPQFNVPFFLSVPFVCTVHDFILHRYPNQASFLKRIAYRLLMKRSVTRAKKIMTISEFTRGELRSLYGERAFGRTVLAYPGVSPLFSRTAPDETEKVLRKHDLQPGYLLYVGNAKEHKQVPLLIRAFEKLNDPSAHLVLVASGKEARSLTLPSNVRLLQDVHDQDFPALYTAAAGCVSASACEGFGLPFAEAFACGCPVAAFRVTSIPEVTGDLAILTEPDEQAMSDAMRRLLDRQPDDARRQELRRASERFTWTECANKIAAVFQTALSGV